MTHGAGVDVGSTQTKAVIVNDRHEIVARVLIATGANVNPKLEAISALSAVRSTLPRTMAVRFSVVPEHSTISAASR